MGRVIIHIFPAIFFGFIMQIILHEVGHLLGGLITGWKFLYLQIYRLVLKKENKRLRALVVGETGYRCIMYPNSVNTDAILYTMGGCTFNLLLAVIGLIAVIMIPMYPVLWLYAWSYTVFGVGLFFMNGIASTKRVCNDKACYDLLAADKHNKLCHNAQLIIARHLMSGLSYSEIGEEAICLCPDLTQNDIQIYQAVLEYYYYLDVNNPLKMVQAINKIRSKENISRDMLRILDIEFTYIRLLCAITLNAKNISKRNPDKINWDSYKAQGGAADIHTMRVKTVHDVYMYLVAGNKDRAVAALDEALKLINKGSYIYEGERKFCIRQLINVRGIIESGLKEK